MGGDLIFWGKAFYFARPLEIPVGRVLKSNLVLRVVATAKRHFHDLQQLIWDAGFGQGGADVQQRLSIQFFKIQTPRGEDDRQFHL